MVAPFRNRQVEIVRHSHRQGVERKTAGSEIVPQLAQQTKLATHHVGVGVGLGDSHQAAQLQARQDFNLPRQLDQGGRVHTALGALPAHVYLDTDLQRGKLRRALIRKSLSHS